MDRDEALRLLEGGADGVNEWNRRRDEGETIPVLEKADLSRAKLHKADLSRVNLSRVNLSRADLGEADLRRADLGRAKLHEADLWGADLSGAKLYEADLSGADLRRAQLNFVRLWQANLSGALLSFASLGEANLSGANLSRADLSEANLCEADLSRADLSFADLRRAQLNLVHLWQANLSGANFERANVGWTIFGDVDLSSAKSLHSVAHAGPSTVGLDTLHKSEGKIPKEFLRGCGLTPWEIEIARLYDQSLSGEDIAELLSTKLYDARAKGPLYIGGVFISYSRDDSKFVDKVYKSLYDEGASVWLDRHDALAGSLTKQVSRAIRLNDVVLLVLSNVSVKSDWVEHELNMARKKEKEEKRDVLCPVALDDSWKVKVEEEPLWHQLTKKNILDFSGWKTKTFGKQFEKLVKGLKINYPRE